MKAYTLKQAPNFPQKKVSAIKPFHTRLMSVDDSVLPSQVKLFIDRIITKEELWQSPKDYFYYTLEQRLQIIQLMFAGLKLLKFKKIGNQSEVSQ